jgi:hypothetical protein
MNSMERSFGAITRCAVPLAMMALLFIPMGCGAVGPPIPPEEVGIEAAIRKQRQDQAEKAGSSTEDQYLSPVEEPVELPEFYPIDNR